MRRYQNDQTLNQILTVRTSRLPSKNSSCRNRADPHPVAKKNTTFASLTGANKNVMHNNADTDSLPFGVSSSVVRL